MENTSNVIPSLKNRLKDLHEIFPIFGTEGFVVPEFEGFKVRNISPLENGNWVIYHETFVGFELNKFHFAPTARDNIFVFDEKSSCIGNHYIVGSKNTALIIGEKFGRNPVNVHFHSSECLFYFGKHCTSNTTTFELGGSNQSILCGYDCMFSAGVHVMTSDEHAVLDVNGQHINQPASILFHPHVWVGFEAMVLKGAVVGFNSVIAARSVVTGIVPPNSIVAGSPARFVRDISGWIRDKVPTDKARQNLTRLKTNFGDNEFMQ